MKYWVLVGKLAGVLSRPVRALWIEIYQISHISRKERVEAREGLVD